MVVRDIQQILESWAPREIAWERDNVGLQVGSPDQHVGRILVSLDVTDETVQEARRKNVNLIISHHPLLFHPLKSVNADSRVGRLVMKLVQWKISLFSTHTNLDFAHGGVSFALAHQLGLENVKFLTPHKDIQKKITVFVPPSHRTRVMEAMAKAGAGQIGKYSACAFSTSGTGSFRPDKDARPYIGKQGNLEHVDEIRLEMTVPQWKVDDVINAMRHVHPYEEVAYDVYELSSTSDSYGTGAMGHYRKPMHPKDFLNRISKSLKIPALRYRGTSQHTIQNVAVCGGSGSDLLPRAIQRGADALVTSDVTYHRFEEADNRILLIDAGHFETEQPVVKKMTEYLKTSFARHKADIKVLASKLSRNPVHYYLS